MTTAVAVAVGYMDNRRRPPPRPVRRLALVREVELASRLPAAAGGRLEASGVLAAEGCFSCEGNRCRDGAEGRRPGGGRIQVFDRSGRHWDRIATIRSPAVLPFEDFSSVAVAEDRLAVL